MSLAVILRSVGALAASFVVVLLLLIAVEVFSSVVHPLPADFDGSMEQMCAHVARYPYWVLVTVLPLWGGIAFLGTWLAGRLGNRSTALVMAVLLLAAASWNLAMLPYPLWFQIVQGIVILVAVVYGRAWSAGRPAPPRSPS